MSFGKSPKRKNEYVPNYEFNTEWEAELLLALELGGKSLHSLKI